MLKLPYSAFETPLKHKWYTTKTEENKLGLSYAKLRARPPQSETVPARFFWVFMCLLQKNTLQPCLLPLLVLDFVVSMHFFTPPVIFIPLLQAFNHSNDFLVYCAWQTNNVPARKSSGLCRLWRSGEDLKKNWSLPWEQSNTAIHVLMVKCGVVS